MQLRRKVWKAKKKIFVILLSNDWYDLFDLFDINNRILQLFFISFIFEKSKNLWRNTFDFIKFANIKIFMNVMLLQWRTNRRMQVILLDCLFIFYEMQIINLISQVR